MAISRLEEKGHLGNKYLDGAKIGGKDEQLVGLPEPPESSAQDCAQIVARSTQASAKRPAER